MASLLSSNLIVPQLFVLFQAKIFSNVHTREVGGGGHSPQSHNLSNSGMEIS